MLPSAISIDLALLKMSDPGQVWFSGGSVNSEGSPQNLDIAPNPFEGYAIFFWLFTSLICKLLLQRAGVVGHCHGGHVPMQLFLLKMLFIRVFSYGLKSNIENTQIL